MRLEEQYAQFFETLREDLDKSSYGVFFDDSSKFRDPFHEVYGLEKIVQIFKNMYITLDNPRFHIIEIISNENISYIKWNFTYNFKNSNNQKSFVGLSRVEFNLDTKKVISHEDYWDAAQNIYEEIPILRYFIKLIKKRIIS